MWAGAEPVLVVNPLNAFPGWNLGQIVVSDTAVVADVVVVVVNDVVVGVVVSDDALAAASAFLSSVITAVSIINFGTGRGGHRLVEGWGWQEIACVGR